MSAFQSPGGGDAHERTRCGGDVCLYEKKSNKKRVAQFGGWRVIGALWLANHCDLADAGGDRTHGRT